jgi:hypothetical protein
MTALNSNWITEKMIDFEYKRYVLLAYLQEVGYSFERKELYPHLSELINHYRQVKAIKEKKQYYLNAFPQRMRGIDMENFILEYEKVIQDDSLMQEIENIINYSIPQFEHYLAEGKKIYDFIEEQLHIFPVGVIPLYPEQGYMFLKDGSGASAEVYEYKITIFEQPDVKYRAIHTSYLKSFKTGFTHSFESVKSDLMKSNWQLSNPATYVIETDMVLPVKETFLPIAKRALVKHVAATT